MKYNKMSRVERRDNEKMKREDAVRGEGLFVYENNTKGDLDLPKATASGKKLLKLGEQFQGDSYYMKLVPTMLRYIRCITPTNENAVAPPKIETVLTENVEKISVPLENHAVAVKAAAKSKTLKENAVVEKLILDQPEKVTRQGVVEHVVAEPKKKSLNESHGKVEKDVLLTEDPMEGVEIVLG